MNFRFINIISERFSVKIFIIFLSLVFGISLAFSVFFITLQRNLLAKNITSKGELMSKTLAYNSRLGIFSGNKEMLKDFITGTFQQEGVIEVSIYNQKGKLLIKQEKLQIKDNFKIKKTNTGELTTIFSQLKKSKLPRCYDFNRLIEFWAPSISSTVYPSEESLFFRDTDFRKENNVIGFVRISFDKTIFNKQISRTMLISILIGVSFIFVGFLISYVVTKKITHPLKVLTKNVIAISSGNLTDIVPVETRDEIGKLADAFNQMSDSLIIREKQIHSLTQDLIMAQSKERQEIALELHDSVAQDLVSLKMTLERYLNNHSEINHEQFKEFSVSLKLLDKCLFDIRTLSFSLHPFDLDQLGLVSAIQQHCQDFSVKNNINVEFISAGVENLILDFDIKINLFRVVQEALNNIIRHASASIVTLRLVASYPNIILRIEDNGKGFDVNKQSANALKEHRLGLRGIRERIDLLNGKIGILSGPAKGTKIVIEVPFEEKK